MRKNLRRLFLLAFVLIAGLMISTNASAQIAPYLTFGGDYAYNATSKELSFNTNYADWLDYTDESYDCYAAWGCAGSDPIIGAAVTFGTLTNVGNPLVFSPTTFTVAGYFSATLNNFVVNNSELMWGSLYNIERLDGGTSRYVDELLANGGGVGNLYLSFTPTAGGVENFISDSSGSTGGMVAAPEPVSAILFLSGGATLAFRRYRNKKSQH